MADFQHGAAFEASLTLAAEKAGDLTPLVYARLFAQQPAMAPEFWRDGSGAIKGEMLQRVFEVLLDLAGPRAYAAQMIGTEFITHDAYGIPRAVFGTFFRIVAETVAAVGGNDFTPAMHDAWTAMLGEIETILAGVSGQDVPAGLTDAAAALPGQPDG